jgi:hypothetical protein
LERAGKQQELDRELWECFSDILTFRRRSFVEPKFLQVVFRECVCPPALLDTADDNPDDPLAGQEVPPP